MADSGAKRNGLSEADLRVFAKLLEQRLERGQEAQALPRRQVVGEDDLLQPGVLAPLDGLGPVVDRAPLGDGGARLPGPPPAAPGPPARQQLPELLALLPGAVDEGVDRLDRHSTEPALLAALEPAGDLLRRPPFQQPVTHEAAELGVALENGLARPPLAGAAPGVDRPGGPPGG